MDKSTIRNMMYKLEISDVQNKNDIIFEKLISLEKYKQANSIFVYKSINNEVNTESIIANAFQFYKRVFVPITQKEDMIISEIFVDTEFKKANFGIYEPVIKQNTNFTPDIAIIPMVSFSSNLVRLGHGFGFYDRWLKKNNIFKIGIAFEEQKWDFLIADDNDVAMDIIVTDKYIYGRNS